MMKKKGMAKGGYRGGVKKMKKGGAMGGVAEELNPGKTMEIPEEIQRWLERMERRRKRGLVGL